MNTNVGFTFEVIEHIWDEETDTRMIVVDVNDRIILAFRGTSSKQNMKTDISVVTATLLNGIPTKLSVQNKLRQNTEWLRSKVHKGFLAAYPSISERVLSIVEMLYSDQSRPIFLTGHSLGGALTTLSSLDIPPSDIAVSTFGSPRVGNFKFRKIYNQLVPTHWKFAHETGLFACRT